MATFSKVILIMIVVRVRLRVLALIMNYHCISNMHNDFFSCEKQKYTVAVDHRDTPLQVATMHNCLTLRIKLKSRLNSNTV